MVPDDYTRHYTADTRSDTLQGYVMENPQRPEGCPLFPHADKQWAKKVKGKLRYYGPWSDLPGAIASYEADTTPTPTTTPSVAAKAKPAKPAKDYPDYPLTDWLGSWSSLSAGLPRMARACTKWNRKYWEVCSCSGVVVWISS